MNAPAEVDARHAEYQARKVWGQIILNYRDGVIESWDFRETGRRTGATNGATKSLQEPAPVP